MIAITTSNSISVKPRRSRDTKESALCFFIYNDLSNLLLASLSKEKSKQV
jgi:hypothetical protein